jgi:hypothetical protein
MWELLENKKLPLEISVNLYLVHKGGRLAYLFESANFPNYAKKYLEIIRSLDEFETRLENQLTGRYFVYSNGTILPTEKGNHDKWVGDILGFKCDFHPKKHMWILTYDASRNGVTANIYAEVCMNRYDTSYRIAKWTEILEGVNVRLTEQWIKNNIPLILSKIESKDSEWLENHRHDVYEYLNGEGDAYLISVIEKTKEPMIYWLSYNKVLSSIIDAIYPISGAKYDSIRSYMEDKITYNMTKADVTKLLVEALKNVGLSKKHEKAVEDVYASIKKKLSMEADKTAVDESPKERKASKAEEKGLACSRETKKPENMTDREKRIFAFMEEVKKAPRKKGVDYLDAFMSPKLTTNYEKWRSTRSGMTEWLDIVREGSPDPKSICITSCKGVDQGLVYHKRDGVTVSEWYLNMVRACIADSDVKVIVSLVGETEFHSNALVYVKSRKTVYRFEPNGEAMGVEVVDMAYIEYVKEYFPAWKYRGPKIICPGDGPQALECRGKCLITAPENTRKVFGKTIKKEMSGFCGAWSMMFVHLIMYNPGVFFADIVKGLTDMGSDRLATMIRSYVETVQTLTFETPSEVKERKGIKEGDVVEVYSFKNKDNKGNPEYGRVVEVARTFAMIIIDDRKGFNRHMLKTKLNELVKVTDADIIAETVKKVQPWYALYMKTIKKR